MTPIRNVTDRERELASRIDLLEKEKAFFIGSRNDWKANHDKVVAERDALKQANSDLARAAIIEDGWQLVPIEPTGEMWSASRSEFIRYAQRYEAAKTAGAASIIGDIAGPDIYKAMLMAAQQGYTAEQIGLQLDDRREGLGAHHVYCRVIGEDV